MDDGKGELKWLIAWVVMRELKPAETADAAKLLGIRLDGEPSAVRQRVEDIATSFAVVETIRRINEHGDLGSTIIKKC